MQYNTLLKYSFPILLVASLIVFTANLGGISIYILDEAKNATCAREMFERGDWVVPTFNQELRTDKPPLHYYFMQVAYRVFGTNEFAARFFSALMGLGTVLITFGFASRLLNKATGFWAGIVMLASIQFAVQFHLATPDPYLIFFITLGLFSFVAAHEWNSRRYLLLFYFAIACATLAKGPVAIALPGLILLAYLLLRQQLTWASFGWSLYPWGVLLFLVLVVPWYVLVHIETEGAYTEGFFFKHNVSRFTSTMEGHGGSIFLIPLFVITGLFPFSLFIGQGAVRAWQNRTNSLLMLSLITVAVFVGFFSISQTKLPSYPVPCFPFAALLIGYYFDGLLANFRWEKYRINLIVWSILALCFPIGIYVAIVEDKSLHSLPHLSYYFALLPIGGLAIWFFARKRPVVTLGIMAVSFYSTALLFFYEVFPQADAQNPVVKTQSVWETHPTIIAYERYNPAFSFYHRQPIDKLPSVAAVKAFVAQYPETLVLTNTRDDAALDSLGKAFEKVGDVRDLFETRKTRVYRAKR